jgi:CubicO group peptidase (beta-lactamase class C family)
MRPDHHDGGPSVRRAAWIAAAVAGVAALAFLAVVARWFAVAGVEGGFDGVVRLLRHGTTTIDDFRHYPGRRLSPSDAPFRFSERVEGRGLPEVVDVAALGSTRIDDVLDASGTIAFVVVQDDAIVDERYANGHTAATPSQYFSVTKSVTSALVGAALDDGILRSVDQPVVEIVPEYAGRGFDRLTLRHLLAMTSGIDYTEDDNPFGLHVPFNYTSDIEHMMLAFRMGTEPGSEFRYKSGDVGLVALVLSRALAPETLTAYAQRRLWTPLGMEHEGIWSLDREDGLEKAWCCLAGTAVDLAKIGRLYLAMGAPGGDRILAQGWIERSIEEGWVDDAVWPVDFAAAGFRNYGATWWLLSEDEGDYLAQGKDGQFLYVHPPSNTIIVRLGRSAGDLRTSQWVSLFRDLARRVE